MYYVLPTTVFIDTAKLNNYNRSHTVRKVGSISVWHKVLLNSFLDCSLPPSTIILNLTLNAVDSRFSVWKLIPFISCPLVLSTSACLGTVLFYFMDTLRCKQAR